MKLGYVIAGKTSNDAAFFNGQEPAGTLCPVCGTCLNYAYAPRSMDVSRSKRYDVAYTHDLRLVFSERFAKYARDILKCDEEFVRITSATGDLFYFVPERVVPFDTGRRKTAFDQPCLSCGGYLSIVGARPAFLKVPQRLGSGFFRSNVPFGTGRSKFPLYFVSEEWKQLLVAEKFRGIEFEPVSA